MPLLILLWIVSLIAPPAASMTTIATVNGAELQAVIHLLNSDDRYTDYAIAIVPPAGSHITASPPECTPALDCVLSAPRGEPQAITVTMALDTLPPECFAQRAYTMIVSGRVLTTTAPIGRTEIGILATRDCPNRLYIP